MTDNKKPATEVTGEQPLTSLAVPSTAGTRRAPPDHDSKAHLYIKCAADQGPNDIKCSGTEAELTLEAADPNAKGPSSLPKFSMAAYNGGPMKCSGWHFPVVVDIAGLSIPARSVPIRLQHDPMQGVGHTTEIDVGQNLKITAKGLISRSTPAAQEVAASGKNNFPWQSSIGASIHETEWIPEGKSVRVNGRSLSGPLTVARKSTLNEISFVDHGADQTTSATVAASTKESTMEKTKEQLEAEAVANKAKADADIEAKAKADALKASNDEVGQLRAARAAENRRMSKIETICGKNAELAAKAIEEGWSEEKAELEAMRAERAEWTKKAPNAIIAGSADHIPDAVLECAMIQACATSSERKVFEKGYDEKTLDAAHKRFRGQLGLKQMLLEAAWASGKFHGRSFDGNHRDVLQAAFSTLSLPNILSNNMNKFLLDSFNAIESTWRDVSAIGNVRDFKQKTSLRLGGAMEYTKVGPQGELKNVSPAEVVYTNQASTYGAILSVSRQDIINDDLGALSAAPRRLGRGAALRLNKEFWTAFLSNPSSNFYKAGNGNYLSGGGSALSLAALTTANTSFRNQTDPDGEPLGYPPAVLLVAPANEVLAISLMRSQELRDTTASTKYGTTNVFAGRYKPVVSTYLSNSAIVNNSTTVWFLLADPKDLAVIEVAFLNGQESPVVESTEADFDTLGIKFRGYHDFGVALQEYRAGVMSAGA